MGDFITALLGQVTQSNLWAALTPVAPWVGAMLLFAIPVYFISRSIRKAGKAKAGI